MRKLSFLFLLSLWIFFGGCSQKNIETDWESLTNKQKMQLLKIDDPSIWNTLAVQSIDLGEQEPLALKSAMALQECPKGDNYYFSIYEDLYPSDGDYGFNDFI